MQPLIKTLGIGEIGMLRCFDGGQNTGLIFCRCQLLLCLLVKQRQADTDGDSKQAGDPAVIE